MFFRSFRLTFFSKERLGHDNSKSYEPIFTPVNRKVKGYTRFVGRYTAGRTKRSQLYEVHIVLISITNRVDQAMSVCLSFRMNAEIWETTRIQARKLWLGMQILELIVQRKFVSARCHAQFYAHNSQKFSFEFPTTD